MIRVVLDTNIWISSLLNPGNPPGQIRHALKQGNLLELCCSQPMLEELEDVLSRPHVMKFSQFTENEIEDFLNAIPTTSVFFETLDIRPVIADDPDDDVVLATALAGKVDLIISGDKHLLELGAYEGIPIMTARQLVELLDE